MTILVVILIIVGIALIILSLFLVEENKFNPEEYAKILTDRELSFAETGKIRDRVDEIITEVRESHIVKTDDELSQLSNEKIIAVNDFSEQVLEKISRNHEEVIFLYNMLNEKQEELKKLMLDASKIKVKLEEPVKIVSSKKEAKHNSANQDTYTKEAKNVTQINVQSDSLSDNHNQKILELYSQGFSIVDISKSLELGQGEVKLVVDLFKQA
ncbi:MAG: hypothetical protein K0S61_390 [Anaerocolumna sp.]|jgi:hypothetical protein|nr:hypothetical protein [Anaerocolumna sp.]